LIVFTETKQVDLVAKFRREADAYYVEAKRSIVSSVAQIPMWMYMVLVVLGWNEAMAVLFTISRTVGGEVQRQVTNRLREHFTQQQLAAPISASNKTSTDHGDDEFKIRSSGGTTFGQQ